MSSYASCLIAIAVLLPASMLGMSSVGASAQKAGRNPALMKPSEATEQAPENFKVRVDTSAGTFVIEVHRDWAPIGADRFYNLVKMGFYDGTRFFRVIPGYIAQFGIHGDPEIHKIWRAARIRDEPLKQSNKRGYVGFNWQALVNSRTTLLFINLADNPNLDKQIVPVAPFGQIVSGMEVVDKLYSGYGETAPTGQGPDLYRIYSHGNAYLEKEFPKLDYIKKAAISN